MKYQEYKERIETEIDSLNLAIDEKILRGLSYRREAKRHRDLIRQVRRERRTPFFSRVAAYVSLF